LCPENAAPKCALGWPRVSTVMFCDRYEVMATGAVDRFVDRVTYVMGVMGVMSAWILDLRYPCR